jgi:hypothetical protein
LSQRSVVLVAVLSLAVLQMACNAKPDPPEVAPKPLSYSTRKIAIPGCALDIPPVRDDDDNCPLDEIGKSIRTDDVCLLLTALKSRMANLPPDAPDIRPDDWSSIRAISVCRINTPPAASRPNTPNRQLQIVTDGPERQRGFWVAMQEDDRKISFGRASR